MDAKMIKNLLEEVAAGKKSPSDATELLRDMPFADLGVAKHDSHRVLRNGFSEVILCEWKKTDHLIRIIDEMMGRNLNIFGTRASEEKAKAICERFPKVDYDSTSRTFKIINRPTSPEPGKLAIMCAGTADMSVAEEARRTAEFFGIEATRYYDVGVAGLHRLMGCIDLLRGMDAVVVAAGMEGALPSVVGGLVPIPIIAVPTSVGYGANLGGITALLGMLNSCSEGITVVNIDNGFGAACAALRVIRNKRTEA